MNDMSNITLPTPGEEYVLSHIPAIKDFSNHARAGVSLIQPYPTAWNDDAKRWLRTDQSARLRRKSEREVPDEDPDGVHDTRELIVYDFYDNPFYYFDEMDGDREVSAYTEGAHNLVSGVIKDYMDRFERQALHTTAVPSWTGIRDTSLTIDYHRAHIGAILNDLQNRDDRILVVLPDDYNNPEAVEEATSFYSTSLSSYNRLIEGTQSAIENFVIRTMDTRTALQFMSAKPGYLYGAPSTVKWDAGYIESQEKNERVIPNYHFNGSPKWFVEARILAMEEAMSITKNYDTIIFVGASKAIAKEQLRPNAVANYLAKLGRINTRVVYLG